jgi:hypothetical protein
MLRQLSALLVGEVRRGEAFERSRVGPGSPPGPSGIRYLAATKNGAGLFLNTAAAGDRAGSCSPIPPPPSIAYLAPADAAE